MSCVDDLCRAVMNVDEPFGGKIVVMLGDFRQTCPVIPGGTKRDVLNASIKFSALWQHVTTFHLTIPIRNAADPEFAQIVEAIGNGAGPQVDLTILPRVEKATEVVDFVFPPAVLTNPLQCSKRAILAPTHAQVDQYNDMIISSMTGPVRTYLAADNLKEASTCDIECPQAVLDYVARQTPYGLPHHTVRVKEQGVYRLLRNFSIELGLVKNSRVIVDSLGERIIAVRLVITETEDGVPRTSDEPILIPRITFEHNLRSGHTLQRHQFPLAPAYATTFNSCQGLTLDKVGVDLTVPVFGHGQLYTALSRIRHRTHGTVRLPRGETRTLNVTYPELLL